MLSIGSIGSRALLRAEHCRYGTRDLSLIKITADENGVYRD
jgi:hypothetical protein